MPDLGVLPVTWEAGPVRAVEATASDETLITTIFEELEPIVSLLGPEPADALARDAIFHHELPPNGTRDRARSFRLDLADEIGAGILSIYHGHPSPTVIYIGSLFVRPAAQGKGVGRAVVGELERRASAAAWTEIRLAVGLLNWPALRFWMHLGYDRITKMSGDEEYGPGKFAVIELARHLTRGES